MAKKKVSDGEEGVASLDIHSIYEDSMDTIAKRQGFEASSLDVVPPMSTGLLALDLVMGGGIRPSMVTGAGEEQCAKTTTALHVMGSAIIHNIPIIAFCDYEGCVTRDTRIGHGRGKQARLDELFDLSDLRSWKPGTWVGQTRRDIDTVEPGHRYGGTGVRTGELFYKGKKLTTELVLNTGHVLRGHGHKMFVLRKNAVEVKRLEDLLPGEQMLVQRSEPQEELWRPVVGFGKTISRRYEVSNHGNVRSLDFPSPRTRTSKLGVSIVEKQRIVKGRILKPQQLKDGHLWVCLSDGETSTKQLVHRLVARAFLGKPTKNKPLVLHWNDDPSDNRASNLHYGSALDNTSERTCKGRSCCGSDVHTAKLTETIAKEILALRGSDRKAKDVASQYKLDRNAVYGIWSGRYWSHLDAELLPFEITPELLVDYEVATVVSVVATGKKEHVFDVSLRGVKSDLLPHSILTNGVVTHNSTKNSKPYVHSILKGMGIKLSMDQVFGKKSKEGGWEIRPRVRYRSEVILERFYDWLSEILRELPDKRYVEGKWWLIFDDKNKRHKAAVEDHVDAAMTRKYGNGLWVPAPDDKIQGIIFVDSYTAMNPEAKDEESISNQLSVKASAFSKQLERVKGRMSQKMVCVYGLNHLRSNPMAMFGPKTDEKGGNALKQFSDVRLRQVSRALSAAPFAPKKGKKTFDEQEPSVEFEGLDTYRYVHVKANKNKLWTPQREGLFRIWVEDAAGVARGLDPVFDTIYYLQQTGQLSGNRGGFKLNLEGLGPAKKPIPWQFLKKWILGDRAAMTKISQALGYKPLSIRKFCFTQMQKGIGEELYVKFKSSKAGKDSDKETFGEEEE